MKKILHLIICSLLISLFFQPLKAKGGLTCASAVTIVNDTNRCVFKTSYYNQWFKIRVPFGKKLHVSNCNLTTLNSSLYWYYNCTDEVTFDINYCGNQKTGTGLFDKDTTIYINWRYYSTDSFNFVCKLVDPQPGEFFQSAIKANEGIFNVFCNNTKVWYKYTAEFDCKLSVKGIDPNDNGYVYFYYANHEYLTTSGYPINNSVVLKKGETIYFYFTYYGENPVTCELKAEPIQVLAGRDFHSAIDAKIGLNRVNNKIFERQWFKYKASESGVISVSTCGLTDYYTSFELLENNADEAWPYEVKRCKDRQAFGYYKILKGDSIYIVWNSSDGGIYDFDMKFTPLSSIAGATPQTAITAVQGTNNVTDIKVDQWFKIVSPGKNSIRISTCGLTDESTAIYLYKGYPDADYYYDKSSDYCTEGNQSNLYYIVNKGDTCYIRMRNIYVYNNYSFTLEFKPLKTEAKIFDFNIYSSTWDTTRILLKKTINTSNKTIDLVVSKNQSITGSFYSYFKISDGAVLRYTSGGIFSNWTSVNYSTPLSLKLISEDSSVIENWTVNLSKSAVLSSDHNFYSFNFSGNEVSVNIDTTNHKITGVLSYNSSLYYLYPYFSVGPFAKVKRGLVTITSGNNSFNYNKADTLTVVAEDGSTQKWVVTATLEATPKAATCADAYTAVLGKTDFVRQGYVYYKFVAPKKGLYSLVNHTNDYNYYALQKGDCSGSFNYYYPDNGDSIVFGLNAAETMVIRVEMYSGYWTLNSLPLGTGKDILDYSVDYRQITVVDKINHKINITIPAANFNITDYVDLTLSPGATAKIGDIVQTGYDLVDFTNDITYTVTAQDGTTQNWTVSVKSIPMSTGKDFLSFFVPCQTSEAVIDPDKATVKISISDTVTFLKNIVPYFVISENAEATISTVNQYSGSTSVDFSNPVTYKITAEDNSTKNWVVTLVKGVVQNSAANVVAFHLPTENSVTIDTAAKTISIAIKSTTFANQVASFTLSKGATAKIGTVDQVSGTTVNDFSSAKVYAVTSQDGLTTKNWTVNVTKAKNNEANILTYSIPNGSVVIKDLEGVINVTVPNATNLNSLVATFTVSEYANVKVGSTAQVSGTTANNFTSPVSYIVTAEDGTTKLWTVNVTKALLGEANILTLSCAGINGLINATTKTISVTVPVNLNITSLAVEFTLSAGAVAKVNNVEQVSGVTKNNFTTAVDYVITSQDGNVTNTYHVIIRPSEGINELSDGLQLYPNPATDYINLKLNTSGKIRVELINMLGGVVYSKVLVNENTLQINLGNIKSGAYYLRVTNSNSSVTRKVEIVK